MDADAVLWAELHERGITDLDALSDDEVVELALRYAVWIPVDTYVRAPWLAPYAVRKIRIRTDDRAPGEKRDLWGMPDEAGYFTDDNSLIKAVFKNRAVRPASSPYESGRFRKGMVCCHVWAGTTTDPLLFSFVPNLVWMPRSLAPYSDNHHSGAPHLVHDTLKWVAADRYRSAMPEVAADRVIAAWNRLAPVTGTVPVHEQLEFDITDQIVKLVDKRLTKLTGFLSTVLADDGARPKRFSRRYHAATGRGIDPTTPPIDHIVTSDALIELLDEMERCQR